MKKILVPTDFSEPSYYGLDKAAVIARKSKASLHIFNVCEIADYYYAADPVGMAPPASIMFEGFREKILNNAKKKLDALKNRSTLKNLDVSVSCEASNNIHFAITDLSDKLKADMIVMGSHGAGNLTEIILGSTAERVVRYATKPVLVIPVKPANKLFSKIVFASDFLSEAYGIFPFVQNFAKICSAKINLFKVNTLDQFSRTKDDREKIHDFFKKFGGKFDYAIYNDYMKEEGIINYSREINADLIAIGTHGKKGLKRFFSEDVSGGIVRLSHIPILIVNLKKYKPSYDLKSKKV